MAGYDRLTGDLKALKAYCMNCDSKPVFGKCDIGDACFNRQMFLRLKQYEDSGLSPEQVQELKESASLD